MITVAVVLAGGASRRYGSDKLIAEVEGIPLLDRALSGLAPERRVIIVGPERPVTRTVEFVIDDHPAGGPAAAMITGLRAALEIDAELIMVLPGDAPAGGTTAEALRSALIKDRAKQGVLAVDREGREQPLQFAIRRTVAERLIEDAGQDGAEGRSARGLITPLGLERMELDQADTWDIDTPEQRFAWAWRDSEAVRMINAAIDARTPESVILIGSDPATVTAVARAVTLARNGVTVEPAVRQVEHGSASVILQVPSFEHRPVGLPLIVGIREPGQPPVSGRVDLWVARPS